MHTRKMYMPNCGLGECYYCTPLFTYSASSHIMCLLILSQIPSQYFSFWLIQFSSLGSLDEKWMAELASSMSSGFSEDKVPLGLGDPLIIWPTVEDVRCSLEVLSSSTFPCLNYYTHLFYVYGMVFKIFTLLLL